MMRSESIGWKSITPGWSLVILTLLTIGSMLPAVLSAGQTNSLPDDSTSQARFQTWQYRDIWADEEQLNDIVVADVIPDLPGEEIITVGDNYFVTMITGNGQSWQSERIYDTGFLARCIAAGDFYPLHPGLELVVGDALGFLTMLFFDSDNEKWYIEQIYEDYDWILDVAVGDIDPDRPGDEILSVGESQQLIYIYFDSINGTWSNEIIWKDTDNLNVVSIGELNDPYDGLEIVVAGSTFDVTLIDRREGDWHIQNIWHETTFIKELEIAEIDGNDSTGEILVMGFNKKLLMLTNDGTDNWLPEVIWNDKGDINDIIIRDFQPEYSGLEIAAVGGSGNIVMLAYDGGFWHNVTVYSILHFPIKIALGDFDAFSAGEEFAMLESIGRVTALNSEKFDFSLVTPKSIIKMFPGETVDFDILVNSNGGFDELVYLNVENIILPSNRSSRVQGGTSTVPSGRAEGADLFEIDLHTAALVPTDFTSVSITASEAMHYDSAKLVLVGASVSTRHLLNLSIQMIFADTNNGGRQIDGMNIILEPRITYLVADYSTNILANLEFSYSTNDNQSNFNDVTFTVENAPIGVQLLTDWKRADFTSSLSTALLKFRADTNVPTGTYYIFISAEIKLENMPDDNIQKLERVRILQVIIEPPGTQDFLIEVSPGNEIEIFRGVGINWTLTLITHSSFDKTVELELDNPNTGVSINLSSTKLSPFISVQMELDSSDKMELTKYSWLITAKSDDRFRFEIVSVSVIEPLPGFELVTDPASQEIDKGDLAKLNLTFKPGGGFENNIFIKLFHDDNGDVEWKNYGREIYLSIDKTVEMIISNLTTPGVYNFTVHSGVIDVFETAAHFTVTVKDPAGPGNGPKDGNGEYENGENANRLLFAIIGIVLIILAAIVAMMFLRKSSARGRDIRRQKSRESKVEAGQKSHSKRDFSGRQEEFHPRISSSVRDVHRKSVKTTSPEPEPSALKTDKSEHFAFGTKVFKPGGEHEFDDLNRSSSPKKKMKR